MPWGNVLEMTKRKYGRREKIIRKDGRRKKVETQGKFTRGGNRE